jgi:hypothetical protein
MRISLALVPLLVAFGCNKGAGIDETDLGDADTDADSDSDTDTDADTDSDTDADCTATIDEIVPLDGSVDVDVETDVTVTFTQAVTETDFSLTVDGVSGTTELAGDGLSATFTPDDPLEFETDYDVTASVCDDSASSTFRTAYAPIDPEVLPDRVYALDYSTVTWESPAVAVFFQSQISIEYILTEIMAVDLDAETLDASGAVGVDVQGTPRQAACYNVIQYGAIDFADNPAFRAGPNLLSVPTAGGDLTIEDLLITATFNADATSLLDIDITGLLDTRPIDVMLGQNEGDVCALASTFGDTCEACGDGEDFCLAVWMTADEAPYVAGVDIDETYDPAQDSNCP